MRDISELPTFPLGTLPPPRDETPRLGTQLGLSRLIVKRDDLTGLALGGNKVRKLEYVIGDVKARGAVIVITSAGPQSNRARMTAAACRKAGLDCILLLAGDYGLKKHVGNLMLDEILGAEVRMIDAPDSYSAQALAEAERISADLRAAGRTPYITEIGGLDEPLVDVGYFMGGREIVEQCREKGIKPGCIVLAIGSGGTHAGVLVGIRASGCDAPVIGVSTDPGAVQRAARVRKHAAALIDWLGLRFELTTSDVFVDDTFSGTGHGVPDEQCIAAVRLAARTEGLLLDPTYVGKVVASIPSLIERKLIPAERPTIIINTGGIVSLFMHTESFAHSATAV